MTFIWPKESWKNDPEKYLSHLPPTFRIGSLCILPGICGFLYHFIPDVPGDVTLKNVSDANPIFKRSQRLMRKKRAILRNIFRWKNKLPRSPNSVNKLRKMIKNDGQTVKQNNRTVFLYLFLSWELAIVSRNCQKTIHNDSLPWSGKN